MPIRRHALGALMALVAAGVALWLLKTHFAGLSLQDVGAAWRALPASVVLMSLGLTGLSFAALSAHEVIACRTVAAGRVKSRWAALAGAAGHAVSNTLGFHAVTGSAVRLRLYHLAGLDMAASARVISMSWIALGLGILTMWAGAAIVGGRPAGWAVAALLVAGLLWLWRGPRRLAWRSFSQPLPTAGVAACLMLIGAAESAASIGALHVLLPSVDRPSFDTFALAYLGAVLLGVVLHVPGGLGVFEAALVSLWSVQGRADWMAALLLYRLVYNLLPFLLALIALGAVEGWRWHERSRLSSRADSA